MATSPSAKYEKTTGKQAGHTDEALQQRRSVKNKARTSERQAQTQITAEQSAAGFDENINGESREQKDAKSFGTYKITVYATEVTGKFTIIHIVTTRRVRVYRNAKNRSKNHHQHGNKDGTLSEKRERLKAVYRTIRQIIRRGPITCLKIRESNF